MGAGRWDTAWQVSFMWQQSDSKAEPCTSQLYMYAVCQNVILLYFNKN